MMSLEPRELLGTLRNLGVQFVLSEEGLKVKSPPGVLTPELKEHLKKVKADIELILQNENQERVSLLPAQKGLLFLQKLNPASSSYHIGAQALIRQNLDLNILRQAVRELVQRHELLRARIDEKAQAFEILPSIENAFSIESEKDFQSHEAFTRPFELKTGPLFRIVVCQNQNSTALAIVLHHLIADALSCQILSLELVEIYRALAENRSPDLAPKARFAEFERRHREYLHSSRFQDDLQFWRKRVDGLTATLPMGLAASSESQTTQIKIENTALGEIRKGLGRLKLTEFQYYLSLYTWLCGKWTLQNSLAVGYPVSGRETLAESRIVGSLINSIPFALVDSEEETVETFLAKARNQLIEDLAHQKCPLDEIVKCFKNPDFKNPGFFHFYFVMQAQTHAWNAFDMEISTIPSREAKFPFCLSIIPQDESLILSVEYRKDLYSEVQVRAFLESYRFILTSVLKNPEKKMNSVKLRPEALGETLISSWRKSQEIPFKSVYQKLTENFQQWGDRPAIQRDQEVLNYGDLEKRVRQRNSLLRRLGVQKSHLVALDLSDDFEKVITILALFSLGAAYLPLDPLSPRIRIEGVLKDAKPNFILCDHHILESKREPELGTFESAEFETLSPGDLAYVIYTSGSTGLPKGVEITHGNLSRLFSEFEEQFRLNPQDRWVLFHSLAFDYSVWEVWGSLLSGACLVLCEKTIKTNPLTFAKWLLEQKITFLNQTPSSFYPVSQKLISENNFGHLRCVLLSGEGLQVSNLKNWFRQFPNGPLIVNSYGITETTVLVSYQELTSKNFDQLGPSPIGLPMPDLKLAIVDSNLEPVPLGFPGEILVTGAGVSRGYLNQRDLNEKKFLEIAGTRFYRSGDLAVQLSETNINSIGRSDRQIKLRGFRIEFSEIENALRKIDNVEDAVVELKKHKEHPLLVAFLILKAGAILKAEDLKARLKNWLPQALIPSHFEVVQSWPLNLNGKIDRDQLFWKPIAPTTAFVSSTNEIEKEISTILTELLGLPVNPEQSFFEMGAHSLLLVTAHQKLQEKLHKEIPLTALFEYPTIKSLAEFLNPSAAQVFKEPTVAITPNEPIAIISMGCRLPDASNLDEFWQQLISGKESIRSFQVAGLKPGQVASTSFLEGIGLFDAEIFNMSPREAELTDPQQRILLELAFETLYQAGYGANKKSQRIGTFVSSSMSRYLLFHLLPQKEKLADVHPLQIIAANDKDYLATKIAYKLNLSGPALGVHTACSSSLVALHQAIQSLWRGECEMALAGGVSLQLEKEPYFFEEGGIGSQDGKCRPFDSSASGTVAGSGAGLVLLKPLSKALADGDSIFAVVKGSAINNDGKEKAGFTAPSIKGQAEVISAALSAAGAKSEDIVFIETHGTATRLGDQIELEALSRVFKEREQKIQLGAVKSQLGHLDAASGIIGLIKTALVLKKREIPAQVYFERFPSELEKHGGAFEVPLRHKKIESFRALASVSSFGLGGTNAHVILETAPEHEPQLRKVPPLVFKRKFYWIEKPQKVEAPLQILEPRWVQVPFTSLEKRNRWLLIGQTGHPFTSVLQDALDCDFVSLQEMKPDLTFENYAGALLALPPESLSVTNPENFELSLNWAKQIAQGLRTQLILLRQSSEKFSDEEKVSPDQHRLQGLMTVLPLEYPGFRAASLDIDFSEKNLNRLEESLSRVLGSDGNFVLRYQKLWKRDWHFSNFSEDQNQKSYDTIWIFGAGGGIGERLIQYWSEKSKARVVAFTSKGQIAAPDRVIPVQINLHNTKDLETQCDRLLSEGLDPDLIFHLASDEEFSLMITDGARALHPSKDVKTKAADFLIRYFSKTNQKNRQIVFFSSLSSEAGSPGHFHYSGANRYLDALAESTSSKNLQVKSVLWGAWKNTGLRRKLLEHFPDLDSSDEFLPEEALAILPRILNSGVEKLVVAKRAPDEIKKARRTVNTKTAVARGVVQDELLAEIWKKHLGLSEISWDDNFFDIGGDSLTALEIKDEIEKTFSVRIAFEDLLKAQTLKKLSELLKGDKKKSNLLVPLSQAEGENLYCVHAVMGTVFPFMELAKTLQPHWKLTALQSPGLTAQKKYESLEGLAEDYLESIKQESGSYPTHLAGWSFGGLVAFEMARQLELRGCPPKSLILFDMSIVSTARQELQIDESELKARFLQDLKQVFKKELSENSEEVRNLFEVFKLHVELTRKYYSSCGDYGAKKLQVPATLFVATDGIGRNDAAADLGWKEYLANLEIETIKGDHYSILKSPSVEELSKRIIARLR